MYHHLLDKIKQERPEWKVSQVKNTLLVVALLLEGQTVNLWKLKGRVGKLLGKQETDSRSGYQRLKRWLRAGEDNKGIWVHMLKGSVSLLTKKVPYLILDGSSWQWGGNTYHFLVLSLLYPGVSIPIYWIDMQRLGNSNQWHRRLLLKSARKLFDLKGKILLADREYIGSNWFATLKQAGLDFVIRLRKGNYKTEIGQQAGKYSKLERKAKARIGRILWQEFSLQGEVYFYVLVAYRNRNQQVELLRLITTLTPAKAVTSYGFRYRIETMFKNLKSNGFDLQSLHVQKAYKVQMLMAALVLAYSLAVVYGLKDFKRKVKITKQQSPQMSVFRWGLDKWQSRLQTFAHFLDLLSIYFKLWLKSMSLIIRLQKVLVSANVP